MPNEFAVVFTQPAGEAALKLLRKAYPDAYEMVPKTVYLVRDARLTADIAREIGIKSDPRVAEGAVLKLNFGYAGFTDRALWEWLAE